MSKFALSGEDGGAVARLGWEKLGYVLEHGCGGAGGCVIEWREFAGELVPEESLWATLRGRMRCRVLRRFGCDGVLCALSRPGLWRR